MRGRVLILQYGVLKECKLDCLPAALGVPGTLLSARGTGLSLDLSDRAEGALEAVIVSQPCPSDQRGNSPPPLPSLFMGTPPATGC